MLWIAGSLLSSGFLAVFSGLNRRYKLNGLHLNFWRMLMATGMLTPVVAFLQWPTDVWFYLTAAFSAVSILICAMIQFNLSAKYNGRVAVMYLPTKSFLLFFAWILIDNASWERNFNNPDRTVGILLTFVLATWALLSMRKNDNGKDAFIAMLPVAVIYTFTDIFIKLVMNHEDMFSASVIYVFLSFGIGALLAGFYIFAIQRTPIRETLPKNMKHVALMLAICGVCSYISITVAIADAPNPAFTNVLSMMTPVWLMIWHWYRGIDDKASPWAGAMLVVSSIALILLTA